MIKRDTIVTSVSRSHRQLQSFYDLERDLDLDLDRDLDRLSSRDLLLSLVLESLSLDRDLDFERLCLDRDPLLLLLNFFFSGLLSRERLLEPDLDLDLREPLLLLLNLLDLFGLLDLLLLLLEVDLLLGLSLDLDLLLLLEGSGLAYLAI